MTGAGLRTGVLPWPDGLTLGGTHPLCRSGGGGARKSRAHDADAGMLSALGAELRFGIGDALGLPCCTESGTGGGALLL